MPNIRFTDDGFNLLKEFCKKRGYKLGSFCEIAAIDHLNYEIDREVEKTVKDGAFIENKVKVQDLTKENAIGKVYEPKEPDFGRKNYSENARFKIVNGKKVFK